MTVGSLFSGIGGLDLGLEWAGFETKWFCEIEKFPQAVLRKHFPNTPIIEDVRNVTTGNVQQVDVIAGGFPCQDISWAGIGRGIDYDLSEQEGTRSGLWWEMWRVIRDLRPRYVIAENVPALTHRGLDIVLGSLAQIGYDAEWQTISAAAVGAPHIRERVFIVAYRNNGGLEVGRSVDAGCRDSAGSGDIRRDMLRVSEKQAGPFVAHANRVGGLERGKQQPCRSEEARDVAHPDGIGRDVRWEPGDSAQESGRRRSTPERREDWQHTSGQRIGQAFVAHPNSEGFSGRREQHTGQGRCSGSESLRGQPDWFAGPIGQPWPVSFKMGNATQLDVESNREGAKQSEADSGERSGQHRGAGGTQDAVEWGVDRNAESKHENADGGMAREQRDRLASGIRREKGKGDEWVEAEYDFRGVAYGVSDRVGALKGYGNAVVPQVGYLVGRAVRQHAEENGWWQ